MKKEITKRDVLKRFNITSSTNSNGKVLLITGRRNMNKLNKKFLFIREKYDKIRKMIRNKIQERTPKGLPISLYLKSLSELGTSDWKTIQNNVKRIGNSSRIYLKKLLNQGFIEIVKNTHPKEYKITSLGEKYLEKNIMYWKD